VGVLAVFVVEVIVQIAHLQQTANLNIAVLGKERQTMPDILRSEKRKARKSHVCSFCGKTINPGEIYDYNVLIFDGVYDWKAHETCAYIASALWNYIDPFDGMTEEDFQEGCIEFCRTFICPDCPNMDSDSDDCAVDKYFCTDKIYEVLQSYDFKKVKSENGWIHTWKLISKHEAGEGETE